MYANYSVIQCIWAHSMWLWLCMHIMFADVYADYDYDYVCRLCLLMCMQIVIMIMYADYVCWCVCRLWLWLCMQIMFADGYADYCTFQWVWARVTSRQSGCLKARPNLWSASSKTLMWKQVSRYWPVSCCRNWLTPAIQVTASAYRIIIIVTTLLWIARILRHAGSSASEATALWRYRSFIIIYYYYFLIFIFCHSFPVSCFISVSIYFVQRNNNNTIKWQEQDNKAYSMH